MGRVFGVRLTGFLAWFAWRTYYLFALPLWERRFRVAFDWTLDLLFPPDIVELKVEPLQTGREALTAGSVSAEKGVDNPRQDVPPQDKTPLISFALESLPHKGTPFQSSQTPHFPAKADFAQTKTVAACPLLLSVEAALMTRNVLICSANDPR